MEPIWRDLKAYFKDGYVAQSSPIGFYVHFCHLKPPLTRNDNIYYGVEINEDMMPLFSSLGDTCAPPCSCQKLVEICRHVDDFVKTAPSTHTEDYSIHTGKGDASIEEASLYAMRDAIHWWAHWHGSLDNRHYWKHMYSAFSTICDDVAIPPQDLINGTFRFLGYTFSDMLTGLRSENVHPDDVVFMEKCLLRQYVLQYLEKVDSELRSLLLSNTSLMVQFRVSTANTLGNAIALLAVRDTKSLGAADPALEMTSICAGLSLDIAKEAMGILQGEPTETVAGDREQLKSELRWIYVRCMEHLDSYPTAHLLRRYATAGLHYVFLMDRYRERLGHIRSPLPIQLHRRLQSYVKDDHQIVLQKGAAVTDLDPP